MATTAILSALEQEQAGLIAHLAQPRQVQRGGRAFWVGHLHGLPVVLALSRIGKVAAATTATTLIEAFGAEQFHQLVVGEDLFRVFGIGQRLDPRLYCFGRGPAFAVGAAYA